MQSRIIFSIIMAFVTSCLFAQQTDTTATKVEEVYVMPRHSVHYEIGGAANGAGVFYDGRFHENSPFGFRTGFSWAFEWYLEKDECFFNNNVGAKSYAIAVPVEVNYLLGRRNHKFEVALGNDFGFFQLRLKYPGFMATGDSYLFRDVNLMHGPRKQFFWYAYLNLGYRFISRRGFQLRAGLNLSTDFGSRYGLNKFPVWPYLSLGKAF